MTKQRGFTLIELMVAVGILGILATLSVGMGTDMLRRQDVNGVAREMYSGLTLARAEAIRQNRKVKAQFTETQLRVFVDTIANNAFDDGEPVLLLYPKENPEREFPAELTMSPGVATFDAYGFSRDADGNFITFAALLVDARLNRAMRVESTVAGAIRIVEAEMPEEEEP